MMEDRDDEMHSDDEAGHRKTLGAETLRAPLSSVAKPNPICVRDDSPIGAAIRLMQSKHFGAVLVTDAGGLLVGIFTERDVIRKVAGQRLDWDSVPVSRVMTAEPESLKMDDWLAFALNYMHMGGYRHVPVVDGRGRPVGIVSIKDIVAYLAEFFDKEVVNLPPDPKRKAPEDRYGG